MAELTTTKPKPFCFVLMPFDSQFDDVYQLGIKEACKKAGAYCERVDEQIFQETILERIYNRIAKADFIVADMTGRNPNVFYEVGYAHALGKPTILLTKNSNDIPVDLKHFPHIVYEERVVELQKQLTRKVEWFVTNPCDKGAERIDIELFVGSENVSSGQVVLDMRRSLPITVHNASSRTLDPGDFKLGIISSYGVHDKVRDHCTSGIALPDDRRLIMLEDFPVLYPDEFAPYPIEFMGLPTAASVEVEILFRVFTRAGTRDYTLLMRSTNPPS